MKQTKIKIGTKIPLVGILTQPDKPTDTAIVLAHGFSVDKEEGGIFTKLAKELTEDGFATFRFDFRYHGESGGSWKDFTVSGEVEDLSEVVDFLRFKKFKKIGIVAASFGGSIGVLYSAKKNPQALCLWNPILDYKNVFLEPKTKWGKRKFGGKWKEIEEKGFLEVNKKKMGKEMYRELKSTNLEVLFPKIKCSVLIVHGDKDTYVPYSDSEKYVKTFGGKSELFTVEGAEHGFHDKKKDAKEANTKTIDFFKKYL